MTYTQKQNAEHIVKEINKMPLDAQTQDPPRKNFHDRLKAAYHQLRARMFIDDANTILEAIDRINYLEKRVEELKAPVDTTPLFFKGL